MAANPWLNIPMTHYLTGPVYRAWAAVSLLDGDMVGKVTVKQASATGWTSDTSPDATSPGGAWVVLEWLNGWADGSKMQVFIGARATSGTLAGFGTLAAGVYVCLAPVGGWDTTNHYFGADLAAWQNGSIKKVDSTGTATVLAMYLTSGIAATRPGAIAFACRAGTGEHTTGCYAGALVPPAGFADQKYRCLIVAEKADTKNEANYWGKATGVYGFVPKTTLDGWEPAYTPYVGTTGSVGGLPGADGAFAQDVDGGYTAAPVVAVNVTTSRTMGRLDGMVYYPAANSTVSGDGTLWFWNRFGWPRDADRDGSWV